MKREIISIENGIVSIPTSYSIWMSVHEIAGLFECFVAKVNSNIRSILESGVLDENKAHCYHHYDNGGFLELYSLEMITALAFRIKSHEAEIFRDYLLRRMTAADKVSVVWKVPLFGAMLN